jgi:hypothetical protein
MENRAMGVDTSMKIAPQHSETDIVVGFIDEWLAEHGWRLDDRVLDFALDVRAMLDEAPVEERQTVLA